MAITNCRREIIHIPARSSPNVRLGLMEVAAGKVPSHRTVTPGVLSYSQYERFRSTWDKDRQCVGLDAQFPDGDLYQDSPIKREEIQMTKRELVLDPLFFAKAHWPHVEFYDKQRAMIGSVKRNMETDVVAGNQLGKDFTAGFIALSFFLCPQMYFADEYVRSVEARRRPGMPETAIHTRRVVTTSVTEKHLNVLWGEIGRYLATSEMPLLESRGGPLVVNAMNIRFKEEREVKLPYNYLTGLVCGITGEGLSGHHADYTLGIGDEASGLPNVAHEMMQGWAKKLMYFGNPNPTNNFWRKAVKAGDIEAQ